MVTNTGLLSEINSTQKSIIIIGRKLNSCQYNKEFYCYCPTIATISLKPIQSPFVSIGPRKNPYHHQLETWTLKFKGWILTTEKLITTNILQIPNPGPTKTILDINWCFARILLKIDRLNSSTAGSTFPQGLTY